MIKRYVWMWTAVLLVGSLANGGTVGWRNDGSGIVKDAAPPTAWSTTSNLLWKVDINSSYSAPIIVGDFVLVTAEHDALSCLNLADGKPVWSKTITAKDLPEAQQTNVMDIYREGTSGNTAATPVSDGATVFTVFGNGLVAAHDVKTGKRLWIQHVETQPSSTEGRSASPILVDGKLIVHLTELRALDAKTGAVLWKQADAGDSYGTPVATKIGKVDVVVTPKGDVVRVSDGKILAAGIGSAQMYGSPVVNNGTVYMIGNACSAVPLPADVTGDKIEVKESWSESVEGEVYCSPVVVDGLAFVCTTGGKLNIFDIKGKTKIERQLELCPAPPEGAEGMGGVGGGPVVWASLTLAGKYLYLNNDSGQIVVLEPTKEAKQVKMNDVGDGSGATMTFAGKKMLIRSKSTLFCVGEK